MAQLLGVVMRTIHELGKLLFEKPMASFTKGGPPLASQGNDCIIA